MVSFFRDLAAQILTPQQRLAATAPGRPTYDEYAIRRLAHQAGDDRGRPTMHFDATPPTAESPDLAASERPWYTELTRYHWFVLIVAALGWLFDTMDQQLFNLARSPAMRELLAPSPGVAPSTENLDFYGRVATSIFMIGWATGGLAFGVLGDRIGRAKVMMWTILLYSAFTALSALSWDFCTFPFFRFFTWLAL